MFHPVCALPSELLHTPAEFGVAFFFSREEAP
jgi:hypothetical protein